VLAGIVGALLAVPAVAVLNSAIRVLIAPDPAVEEARQEAEGEGVMIEATPDTPDRRLAPSDND
jgi:hypothetical protein